MYTIKYTKTAVKDIEKLKQSDLSRSAQKLIAIIKENPFQNPPPYEKLRGDLQKAYSRRINLQHRLVYEIFEDEKIIKVIRMWTHYE